MTKTLARRYMLIIIVFIFSYVGFSLCGLVPGKVRAANHMIVGQFVSYFLSNEKVVIAGSTEPKRLEIPQAMIVDKLDVNISVENPDEPSRQALKQALSRGVVRHPFSGKLGENRPIFIFGHSTGLPFVHNRAYKALNGLEKLGRGDIIIIRSETGEYTFEVEKVERVKAGQKRISFQDEEPLLIISTCNTFGSGDDRIVITARFSGSKRHL